MIERTFEAGFLNAVANHPQVRPWLGGEGPIDLTAAIGDPETYALAGEFGGFVFVKLGLGLYEVHSLVLPEGRGRFALAASRAAARFMFTGADCEEIVTKVPAGNRAALGLARLNGFVHLFDREGCWRDQDGRLVDVGFHSLPVARWMTRAVGLEAVGARFHEQLEAAKAASGVQLPGHAHDPVHDRAVGAAISMARAGQAPKGAVLYNRWARFAGYEPLAVASLDPLIVDIGEAVIRLSDEELEILQCRQA